jgi:CheY-like chemotaxis protein
LNKIIIVDDEETVVEVISRILASKSLAAEDDIVPFLTSDEAWKYISRLEEKPDIIISSVDMDGAGKTNGFDLLTAVKKKFPDVIFVSMSGTPFEEEAKRRGANYFLPKPFSVADIERIFAENAENMAK